MKYKPVVKSITIIRDISLFCRLSEAEIFRIFWYHILPKGYVLLHRADFFVLHAFQYLTSHRAGNVLWLFRDFRGRLPGLYFMTVIRTFAPNYH
jgi:hypothetical protein